MAGIPTIEPYPMPTVDDLPDNIATWSVRRDRAVLLIHDMQRYFLQPFPATETPGLRQSHVIMAGWCGDTPRLAFARPGW